MWPRIGPLPTYAVFYTAAHLLSYAAYWQIARRHALSWRVWLPVCALSSVGGVVASKIFYDLLHPPLDWHLLLTVKHYMHSGYRGGLLASLLLAMIAAIVSLVLLIVWARRFPPAPNQCSSGWIASD